MARKEFTYRGRNLNELKSMSVGEFTLLLPARQRRTLKRGFTDAQKTLLNNLKKKIGNQKMDNLETQCRDMIIIPEMVGLMIKVHNGKEFILVKIEPEMLGHYIGEFVLTRKKVVHSAPGVGATRSSASISVK